MIYFIGEKRSQQAIENNWHWDDNVSTARFLLDRLRELGIEKSDVLFRNLWTDDGVLDTTVIKELKANRVFYVVGMGKIVCDKLTDLDISHYDIVHPAARGKIRNKKLYTQQLREKIGWVIAVELVFKERNDMFKELARL
jgi:hypothetical protein